MRPHELIDFTDLSLPGGTTTDSHPTMDAAAATVVNSNITETTTTTTTSCANDSQLPEDVFAFLYYGWGIIGTPLVGFGLVGNVLSIIVLSHPRMRSSTSCYLIALAVYDSLVLISLLVSFSLPILWSDYRAVYPHINQIAYPFALIAQTCSIYTTVGFTVERYLAVCHPLRSSNTGTVTRARKAILLTLACSILYNIPRIFELKTTTIYNPCTGHNDTIVTPTALGQNVYFRHVYFIGLHMFVFFLIPFCTLMILNTLLIRAVRHSQQTQERMCNRTQRENNLTIMLTVVVAAFLVCELPSIADNILNVVLGEKAKEPTPVKFSVISSLFVITNSAINFYLYCLFGNKFRQVFVDVIFRFQCKSRGLRYQATSILRHNSGSFRATNSFRMNGYSPVKGSENGGVKRYNNNGKNMIHMDMDKTLLTKSYKDQFLSPSDVCRSTSDIYV